MIFFTILLLLFSVFIFTFFYLFLVNLPYLNWLNFDAYQTMKSSAVTVVVLLEIQVEEQIHNAVRIEVNYLSFEAFIIN